MNRFANNSEDRMIIRINTLPSSMLFASRLLITFSNLEKKQAAVNMVRYK